MLCMYSHHKNFKFLKCALCLALSLSGHAMAQDLNVELLTKSKLIPAITKSGLAGSTWLSSSRREEASSIFIHSSQRNVKTLPNGCGGTGSNAVCYDYRSGSTVFKPMRNLLPTIPGLVAQNLTIHRHTLIASYNFK